MVIRTIEKKDLHWNYYLSIIKELETISDYIEFHKDNNDTFSIELAKILFVASSEADVVLKSICNKLDKNTPVNNINDYRRLIKKSFIFSSLKDELVQIPLHSFLLKPWGEWHGKSHPLWWTAYNKVKHERNNHFSKATLKNALNAVGGLLILVVYLRTLEDASPFNKIGFESALPIVSERMALRSNFLKLADHNLFH
jgi:hypothetical protein